MSFDTRFYMLTIAERCRKFRKEKGLTQTEFAELHNVSQSCISKFEGGERDSLRIFLFYVELGFNLGGD